jgi:hypothetical protein
MVGRRRRRIEEEKPA